HFPDSLKYKTSGGRTVYGGGGIMPDIFVPFDSIRYNQLFSSLIRKGVFNAYVNEYLDKNRKKLMKKYAAFSQFKDGYLLSDDDFDVFIAQAEEKEVLTEENRKELNESFVRLQLKALIARNLYDTEAYFEVLSLVDHEINKALEALNDQDVFNSYGFGDK
ncbi:MAG: peptidase S41, partial [Bacteroidetes bacterium]